MAETLKNLLLLRVATKMRCKMKMVPLTLIAGPVACFGNANKSSWAIEQEMWVQGREREGNTTHCCFELKVSTRFM